MTSVGGAPATGAVRAVARHEWRRGRRAWVLVGLLAGVLTGVVLAGATVATRTASAPARLFAAVEPGEAQVRMFGDSAVAARVQQLPSVEDSWPAAVLIGGVVGPSVQYVGVAVPISASSSMMRPVLVEGRPPHPAKIDEVVIVEMLAEAADLRVGDRFEIALLTPEEVDQFDTGFGEPDGPTVEVVVAGVARVPPRVFDGTPVIASPSFAEAFEPYVAGVDVYVKIEGGARSVEAFASAVDALGAEGDTAVGASDPSLPLQVVDTAAATEDLERSSRVLLGGLWVAVLAAAVATSVAVAEAMARHVGGTAERQHVESALGMTGGERVLARIVPAAVTAAVAIVVAVGIGAAGGRFPSAGALAGVDPDQGTRIDTRVLLTGAVAVAVLVLGTAAAAARRAGRDESALPHRPTGSTLTPRRGGWPLAGVAFALSSHSSGGRLPTRTSLAGAVLGIAGVVAATTFGASVERLVDDPARYGWNADMAVIDVRDDVLAELAADPRVAAVSEAPTGYVRIDGNDVVAYALRSVAVPGAPSGGSTRIGWTMLDGREPVARDELVLGPRLADRLGIRVGDEVVLETSSGVATLQVVGLGIGPTTTGEDLGTSALVQYDALGGLTIAAPFREALVRFADGVDVGAASAELGSQLEVMLPLPTREVAEVAQLGSLPSWLGAFLGAIAIAALAHALAVTGRRRRRDLAVLRALGATPGQAALSLVAMSVATAVIGVAIGLPLGWLIARFAWGELAGSIGVAGDVATPYALLAAVLFAAVVVAALTSLAPARRAAHDDPAHVLRAE